MKKQSLLSLATAATFLIPSFPVLANDETLDEEDIFDLDEVVVTGQGAEIRKRRLSSNVQSLSGKALQNLPTLRVDQMLQTAVPNMKINLSGGQPGSTSIMLSRGLSSAFSNSTPVIYVDGIRVDNQNTASALNNDLNGGNYTTGYEGQTSSNSSIADIPMENIERIEFVPGGAATTLYGSDAANGVIQIFTKKGGIGAFNASFTAEMGAEQATSDFYYFRRTADLLHQTALLQRYRLSLDGSTERGGWSLGASMMHTPGTIVGDANEQKKYDVRFGAHYNINKMLEYQTSFGTAFQQMRYARNGNEGLYGGLWTLECLAVTGQTYVDAQGKTQNYGLDIDAYDDLAYLQLADLCAAGEGLSDHREAVRRFQMSHALVFKPMAGLVVKAIAGLDYRHNNNRYCITNQWLTATQQISAMALSSMRNFDRDYLGLTFDANAQYSANPTSWLSSVTTAGFQFFSTDDHQTTAFGKDLRDGSLTINGAATRTSDEYKATVNQHGLFVQENLGFLDRFYLDLGLRADYNSAFGDNVGWQYYPKAGLSYLASEEAALQELSWLNTLRVFTNYGVAGLYPPAFAWQRTIAFSAYQGGLAGSFGQYGNDDLGPERKQSFEAGLNLKLFNRFDLGLTYYHAVTDDALFNVPLPPSEGEGSSLANVGRILNCGWELALGLDIFRNRDWNVTFAGSLNTNHNRVLSTGGAPAFAVGGFSTSTIQTVVSQGESVGYLRGHITVPGEQGEWEVRQYENLGRTMPKVFGTLSLNADWPQLSFFMNGDYQLGGHVHSYDAQFRYRKGVKDDRVPDEALIAFGMSEDGSNRAKIQKATAWNMSNYFVYASDFLKVRNIGITYRLDKVCKGVRGVELGFRVSNPFTVTACPVDPEATISSTLSQGAIATGGLNYATYSAPRQYVGSVKVTF